MHARAQRPLAARDSSRRQWRGARSAGGRAGGRGSAIHDRLCPSCMPHNPVRDAWHVASRTWWEAVSGVQGLCASGDCAVAVTSATVYICVYICIYIYIMIHTHTHTHTHTRRHVETQHSNMGSRNARLHVLSILPRLLLLLPYVSSRRVPPWFCFFRKKT